jgi:hypothetical protein
MLQRDKNRDLFDLNEGLLQLNLNHEKLLTCFQHYLDFEGTSISRANAEERMLKKLQRSLTEDIEPLLPHDVVFNEKIAIRAFENIWRELITKLPGDPWRLSETVITAFRKSKIPDFLSDTAQ